ncbi:anthrone oxygenase family protein [Geodermatophilus sp. SYSU D01176]
MGSLQHTPAGRARPLALLTAVLVGLLAGGMVLIEVVLLPFWRSVPPEEFRRWFTANAPRIRALMVPLGAGAATAGVAAAVAEASASRRPGPASLAAAATVGVVTVTVTVNEPANARFTGGTLTDAETRDLLGTWARWHHLRVALGILATVAAASALGGRPQPRAARRMVVR